MSLTRTNLRSLLRRREPQSRDWRGPGLRKQRPNWQHSHSPLGLRTCAFLKLRNSDERSSAWISCWKSFFTFFTEGKQKIFVSVLKMSERKENRQSSVKHRKSYYEWPLSVWCLSREGREKMDPLSFFFFSLSIKWSRGREAGAGREMKL